MSKGIHCIFYWKNRTTFNTFTFGSCNSLIRSIVKFNHYTNICELLLFHFILLLKPVAFLILSNLDPGWQWKYFIKGKMVRKPQMSKLLTKLMSGIKNKTHER